MILYLDTFSGIAGDMTLGALLDLGVELSALRAELAKLRMGDAFELSARRVRVGAIEAVKADVRIATPVSPSGHGTAYTTIAERIEKAPIAEGARRRALDTFRLVAEAESKIHGVPVDRVHFHEVGAVDSIVDIVGVAVGLELLGVREVAASRVPLGTGMTRTDHGPIPVPVPATLEILRGVPTYGTGVEAELVTPTGAAILKSFSASFGPPPAMTHERVGYGAGDRRFADRPNVLRAVLGRREDAAPFARDRAAVLEAHIDDMNPELYDLLMERLFAAGALDVGLAALQMKKNRPGARLTIVGPVDRRDALAAAALRHSTTLGVRVYEVDRVKLGHRTVEVATEFGPVRVKIRETLDGEILGRHPEYEDVRRAALAHDVAAQRVAEAALKALEDL